MGIKCSLLGHSFSETDVEEEREEQGSEVVITIKETETCERCGKTRVVSENKEVTAIESTGGPEETGSDPAAGDESVTDDQPTTDPTPEGPAESTPAPNIDAAEDDAELLDEESEEAAPESEPATASPAESETPDAETAAEIVEEAPNPATDEGDESGTVAQEDTPEDDAVILEDDDDEDDRDPGEWPEEDRTDEASVEDDWPEETRADEGAVEDDWPEETLADEPAADDGEVAEWPEEDRGDDDDWKPTENLTDRIDRTEIEPAGSATVTVPEGDFECPECGFTTSVESTSLRAGDFCPECHRGSLEHRPESETRKE